MTDAKAISDALHEPFPQWMFEDKQGMTYLSQEFVRERLIDATGNQFDFTIQDIQYRNDGAMKPRTTQAGEIVETPVCVVIGTLTIPGLGSRSEVGVQEMQAGSGADAAYKGAVSDCFKRCSMAFGVGLQQLYIETNKVWKANNRTASSTQQHVPAAQSQPVTEPATTPGADAEQMRAIGMLIKAKFGNNPAPARIKQLMLDQTGKTSRDEMTAADADTFIAWLTAYQPEPPR